MVEVNGHSLKVFSWTGSSPKYSSHRANDIRPVGIPSTLVLGFYRYKTTLLKLVCSHKRELEGSVHVITFLKWLPIIRLFLGITWKIVCIIHLFRDISCCYWGLGSIWVVLDSRKHGDNGTLNVIFRLFFVPWTQRETCRWQNKPTF
jgi:hypothetical protein